MDAALRTILRYLRPRECPMPWAPYKRALSSLDELPLARLVIRRQTSRHARRKRTLGSAVEVRHLLFSSPYVIHQLRITAELRITSARYEEADAWEGGGGAPRSCPPSFRLRTNATLEHIGLVVGYDRACVPLSSSPITI